MAINQPPSNDRWGRVWPAFRDLLCKSKTVTGGIIALHVFGEDSIPQGGNDVPAKSDGDAHFDFLTVGSARFTLNIEGFFFMMDIKESSNEEDNGNCSTEASSDDAQDDGLSTMIAS